MPHARHGHARAFLQTRLHVAWTAMRYRCTNARSVSWSLYGGRGITVCARWNSFEAFAADMGPHPGKGWTLDRKRNSGNYCKSNCRWATYAQQAHNTRATRLTWKAVKEIRASQGIVSISAMARWYKVDRHTIRCVLQRLTWK